MHNTWASQLSARLSIFTHPNSVVRYLSQFRRKLKKPFSTVTMGYYLLFYILQKSHFNKFCVSGDSGARSSRVRHVIFAWSRKLYVMMWECPRPERLLGAYKHHLMCVGDCYSRVKLLCRETYHITSIYSIHCMAWWLIKHRNEFNCGTEISHLSI
jgi:hypothetical protein